MAETITSLEQLHALELEALLEIDRVCRKIGTRWFLHGGTLLGGIREGGPLAWDDDVDISMLKEDFDKFCKLAPQELDPRFKLVQPIEYDQFFDFLPRVTDLAYVYEAAREDSDAFAGRLDHPDIDIFVLEPACSDAKRDRRQSLLLALNYAEALGHRPAVDHGEFSGPAKLASYVLPAIGRRKSMRSIIGRREELAGWGDDPELMRVPNDLPRYWNLRWQRAWYQGDRSCEFSGVKLPVPMGAEEVLVLVYGEGWQTPPPESERVPQHASLA